jgi:hypothetical protein
MNKHTDFILSPISDILREMASANSGVGNGIETFPLSEYVMQAVFLRMTGSQEQKMKCICWELATNDYEYRYKRYGKNTLGECSTYSEKQIIYKDLLDAIVKNDPTFNVLADIDRRNIRKDTASEIKKIFLNSNLVSWSEDSFRDYLSAWSTILNTHIAKNDNLFENVLQDKYVLLYTHRNRCAHNTFSYQENLPTLKSLINKNHKYENYFIRFSLLILIDKVFIELYKRYLKVFQESINS